MPTAFDDTHARVRADGCAVFGYRAGADADELSEVVIQGIQLGFLTRRQGVCVRDAHRCRRVKVHSGGLDADYETGLLAEVRSVRDFVGMDERNGDASCLCVIRECNRAGRHGQRKSGNLGQGGRAAGGIGYAKLVWNIEGQEINRLFEGVVLPGDGN